EAGGGTGASGWGRSRAGGRAGPRLSAGLIAQLQVIIRPAARFAQDVVGFRYLDEGPVPVFLVTLYVRMILPRQLPKLAPNLGRRGGRGETQDLVVGALHKAGVRGQGSGVRRDRRCRPDP